MQELTNATGVGRTTVRYVHGSTKKWVTKVANFRWATSALFFLSVIGAPLVLGGTSNATTTPSCSGSNLGLSAGPGQAAAGNIGLPIIIVNKGPSACVLRGYPALVINTQKPSPRAIRVLQHPQSQIYRAVKPARTVIAPGHFASFGISFVDALGQQFGNGPRCTVRRLIVTLPGLAPENATMPHSWFITPHKGVERNMVGFNICFAGFKVGVTPIESGSTPR